MTVPGHVVHVCTLRAVQTRCAWKSTMRVVCECTVLRERGGGGVLTTLTSEQVASRARSPPGSSVLTTHIRAEQRSCVWTRRSLRAA